MSLPKTTTEAPSSGGGRPGVPAGVPGTLCQRLVPPWVAQRSLLAKDLHLVQAELAVLPGAEPQLPQAVPACSWRLSQNPEGPLGLPYLKALVEDLEYSNDSIDLGAGEEQLKNFQLGTLVSCFSWTFLVTLAAP